MDCPEKIKLPIVEISIKKCAENFEFWKKEFEYDTIPKNRIKHLEILSNLILPCHSTAFENIEKIFFPNTSEIIEYIPEAKGLLSLDIRNNRIGKESGSHMKDSLKFGHEIFLFAYHGVHNPYHRMEDNVPIRPVGLFLKSDIEELTCVHGSPCDTAKSNTTIDEYRNNLEKFYLCPKDLRTIKSCEIFKDKYLQKDFWYYYGNPKNWENEDGYSNRLYERAGEFRYLNNISYENIHAILWPFFLFEDDNENSDINLDIYNRFKNNYPNIKVIHYQVDKYNDKWGLAFVEASYYSQRYFVEFGEFESNADIAKIKIESPKN